MIRELLIICVLFFSAAHCAAQPPVYVAPVTPVYVAPVYVTPQYYTPPGVWTAYQRPTWIGNALFGPVWTWQPVAQQQQQAPPQ